MISFNLGMSKKTIQFTEKEIAHIEELRRHPELAERFAEILSISEARGGSLLNADEVEAQLVEEVRKLGAEGFAQWARKAEEHVGRAHREECPDYYCGKKNV